MRKVILYIAASLDGKIAKPDGDVQWLHNLPNPENTDFGYQDFLNSIDTTLMGNKTYHEILGFDIPFPYQDKINYVFSRKEQLQEPEFVQYIHNDIPGWLNNLKSQPGKDIWLIGGGEMVRFFIDNDLLDEMRVFIMPIILGNGIPLFPDGTPEKLPRLVETQIFNSSNVVMLKYQLK